MVKKLIISVAAVLILFFCLILALRIVSGGKDKIKLYAFYTPSHERLLNEWFLPSIKKYDDYEIVLVHGQQECKTGVFMSQGWLETMVCRVDMIIGAIKENWGKIFIHSDVDIQFFGSTQFFVENAMKNNDIVLQRENPGGHVCVGFFACRGNERTLALFRHVRSLIIQVIEGKIQHTSFQLIVNGLLLTRNIHKVKWDYLSPYLFFGAGSLNDRIWKPGMTLPVPETVVMHHANYNWGMEDKAKQLQYVKDIVESRKHIAVV